MKFIPITDEVRSLIEEAVRRVGSKRRLAWELGYYGKQRASIVARWLSGYCRNMRRTVYERIEGLLGRGQAAGRE